MSVLIVVGTPDSIQWNKSWLRVSQLLWLWPSLVIFTIIGVSRVDLNFCNETQIDYISLTETWGIVLSSPVSSFLVLPQSPNTLFITGYSGPHAAHSATEPVAGTQTVNKQTVFSYLTCTPVGSRDPVSLQPTKSSSEKIPTQLPI